MFYHLPLKLCTSVHGLIFQNLQVGVELPIDSEEADEETKDPNGSTLLWVLGRG